MDQFVTEIQVRHIMEEYLHQYDGQLQEVLRRADEAQRGIAERTTEIGQYLENSQHQAESVRAEIVDIEGKHAAMDDRVTRLVVEIKEQINKMTEMKNNVQIVFTQVSQQQTAAMDTIQELIARSNDKFVEHEQAISKLIRGAESRSDNEGRGGKLHMKTSGLEKTQRMSEQG